MTSDIFTDDPVVRSDEYIQEMRVVLRRIAEGRCDVPTAWDVISTTLKKDREMFTEQIADALFALAFDMHVSADNKECAVQWCNITLRISGYVHAVLPKQAGRLQGIADIFRAKIDCVGEKLPLKDVLKVEHVLEILEFVIETDYAVDIKSISEYMELSHIVVLKLVRTMELSGIVVQHIDSDKKTIRSTELGKLAFRVQQKYI